MPREIGGMSIFGDVGKGVGGHVKRDESCVAEKEERLWKIGGFVWMMTIKEDLYTELQTPSLKSIPRNCRYKRKLYTVFFSPTPSYLNPFVIFPKTAPQASAK